MPGRWGEKRGRARTDAPPIVTVGIDPGQSGALVALSGGVPFKSMVMPLAGKTVDWAVVADWLRAVGPIELAVLEKVHSMPAQGVASTFKFGANYGGLQGVLGALQVPFQLVTPQAWKKAVLEGTAKDKDAAIGFCRQRWPEFSLLATERSRKAHDGIADALCMGHMAWEISR